MSTSITKRIENDSFHRASEEKTQIVNHIVGWSCPSLYNSSFTIKMNVSRCIFAYYKLRVPPPTSVRTNKQRIRSRKGFPVKLIIDTAAVYLAAGVNQILSFSNSTMVINFRPSVNILKEAWLADREVLSKFLKSRGWKRFLFRLDANAFTFTLTATNVRENEPTDAWFAIKIVDDSRGNILKKIHSVREYFEINNTL